MCQTASNDMVVEQWAGIMNLSKEAGKQVTVAVSNLVIQLVIVEQCSYIVPFYFNYHFVFIFFHL